MTTVVILALAILYIVAVLGWWQAERRLTVYRAEVSQMRALMSEAAATVVQLTAALRLRNLATNLGRLPRRPQDRIHVN